MTALVLLALFIAPRASGANPPAVPVVIENPWT
jgi:hypothetical protein